MMHFGNGDKLNTTVTANSVHF